MSTAAATPNASLLSVEHLTKHYPIRKGLFGRRSGQVRHCDQRYPKVAV